MSRCFLWDLVETMAKVMAGETRIDAVVFDCDGLMFNTELVFERTGTELLRRRGHVATPELFVQMMGRRADEAFAAMVNMYQLADPIPELMAESEQIFFSLLDDYLEPMPGLLTLLNAIESYGLPKGVATSSPRRFLMNLLGRYELEPRFSVTMTAEDVSQGKPHPEIYLSVAQRLGVAPERMLVLEDSENGTRSAAAAGAHVISVPHEHSRHHDFSVASGVAERLDSKLILDLIHREIN
ncbi:MAG: HAD family phosphatase [Planctomycetaceae bacterium]